MSQKRVLTLSNSRKKQNAKEINNKYSHNISPFRMELICFVICFIAHPSNVLRKFYRAHLGATTILHHPKLLLYPQKAYSGSTKAYEGILFTIWAGFPPSRINSLSLSMLRIASGVFFALVPINSAEPRSLLPR